MNEAETRVELINLKLKSCGWGVVEGSKILRERNVYKIIDGKIQVGGSWAKPLIADYILVYKGIKLAVVEAKNKPSSMLKNSILRSPTPAMVKKFIKFT